MIWIIIYFPMMVYKNVVVCSIRKFLCDCTKYGSFLYSCHVLSPSQHTKLKYLFNCKLIGVIFLKLVVDKHDKPLDMPRGSRCALGFGWNKVTSACMLPVHGGKPLPFPPYSFCTFSYVNHHFNFWVQSIWPFAGRNTRALLLAIVIKMLLALTSGRPVNLLTAIIVYHRWKWLILQLSGVI